MKREGSFKCRGIITWTPHMVYTSFYCHISTHSHFNRTGIKARPRKNGGRPEIESGNNLRIDRVRATLCVGSGR